MKRFKSIFQVLMALLLVFGTLGALPVKPVSADATAQLLPYSQNWENASMITANDIWSGVPGIIGYLGDYDALSPANVDPQTLLADYPSVAVDVIANLSVVTSTAGGVGEFDGITNPVVALQGSGTADAPYLLINLNTTGNQNITVSYLVRDIDGSADNAAQQVALHFRVGSGGDFTNLPAAYIADASAGPLLTLDTPVSVTLPTDANNQSLVQLRIMTTNATGSDEWVGIDDISVTGSPFAGDTAPTVASTAPSNGGSANASDNVVITFSEPVTVTDGWYSISCVTSGTHTATVTDADPVFTLDPNTNFTGGETCTVTIDHTKVNDDDLDDATADFMTADHVFSFSVPESCGDSYTAIYNIQGSGASSPIVGTTVTTEGVVVGDFQVGGKNGYYIQDPSGDGNAATSDGIFVYNTTVAVASGDHVRVKGLITEWATGTGGTLTELTPTSPASSNVILCSTGNTISATPVSLPVSAVTDFEKYESMLVTFSQDLVISEYFNYDRYGEIVLTSQRHMTPTALVEPGAPAQAAAAAYLLDRITLDDGRSTQNPDPAIHPNGAVFNLTNLFRGGGTVTNITGILDFYQSLYRVQPTVGATYADINPRTAAPEITEGNLKVASFNVLNYFVTLDDGINDICGPNGAQECRGADDADEFTRQRAKILAALMAIDADVFGLMEIENDSPVSGNDAVANLVEGLNALTGPGTYAYIQTGAIGGDAIKQAILYKPTSVTPVGAYQLLTTAVDARFIDTLNRPALAQVFTDNLTGIDFVVAVNHLKSKGSACMDDPDLGDGAGNCNLTRLAAAQALVDWLANPTYFSGVQKTLIIGDLNSYDKEDPIDAIKLGADDTASTTDDFKDMIYEKRGESAYGYVFDGQTGYLDHALASQQLAADIVDVNFWHINADEPDLIDYDTSFKLPAQDALYAPDAYRSSDHDPVLVTLSLNNAPVAVADAYSTAEDTQLVVAAAEGVLANDTDFEMLTAELVDGPTHGTLALSADGSFTYTPDLDFNGEDSFTYKAFDGEFYSEVVTVTLTITPVNDAPVAVADAYTTAEDTQLVVAAPGVLSNDTDVDGDTITAEVVGNVSNGTLTLSTDGSFTYTPNLDFNGEDSFTYKTTDGTLYSEVVTVTITVTPVNDGPTAVDDAYSVDEDSLLSVAAPGVMDNDVEVDTDIMTVTLVSNVSHGTLVLLGDGSFTYKPAANYSGTDTFVYRLITYPAIQGMWTDEATVTITVTPVNDAPVAVADAYTTAEDTTLTVAVAEGVLANDTDVDQETLTAELVDNVANGTLVLAADGSFTYTPGLGFFGEDSFTYKAFDGESYSEVVTVTITVTEEIPVFFNIYLPLIFK